MTHEEIHKTCKKYNITNYIINSDGSIDVNGNVNLFNKKLNKLPLRFNKVSGIFNCGYNELTTLKNCPEKVGGSFYCNVNKLTSLKYAPLEIGFLFICHRNNVELNYESYIKSINRMNKLKDL